MIAARWIQPGVEVLSSSKEWAQQDNSTAPSVTSVPQPWPLKVQRILPTQSQFHFICTYPKCWSCELDMNWNESCLKDQDRHTEAEMGPMGNAQETGQ